MFGNSESGMIALLCLFGGISIASWNALDVITVELYPSDKRYHERSCFHCCEDREALIVLMCVLFSDDRSTAGLHVINHQIAQHS